MPAAIAMFIAAALISPAGDWLSIERLEESRDALAALVEARPFLSAAAFLLLCIAASALCFPAAPLIGIAGGALFGFWPGLVLLSLGFTIGSTLACLGSRHLLRASVHARFGSRLAAIDRGFARHGAAYLLALRINPLVPYWLVNLTLGLTAMRLRTYVPLTFAGLLPALVIYANAGSGLAAARGARDLVSPTLLASLLALSLLPLAADWALGRAGRRLHEPSRLI
ncbi:MAG TPA: VTT domain-containing protein [Allosphingosinicella sp.]